VYGIENHHGIPVYVHAKVCIIDDVWASVGSDNVNRRSWTHDSELSCAIVDERVATDLRRTVCAEHLGTDPSDPALDLTRVADTIAASAAGLGPPGRLRRYRPPELPRGSRLWGAPLKRWVCDPDGRPPELRRSPGFAC
jgi:phosphatidylserine/phosphatidylglycerophosphate/cardiolipin synthase-like enzyme